MISMIITCYQESQSIRYLLDDIIKQTKLPDELIIVDAGSNDGTVDIIQSFRTNFQENNIPFYLIEKPGIGIAEGRNIAIRNSNFPIIAVTDAGCRLDKNWIANITKPFDQKDIDMVGGFFLPITYSMFQKCLALLTTTSKPDKNFLPSSRSIAFRKNLWEKVQGYPEWLPWGEDSLFNRLCLQLGAKYSVAEDAIVYWEVRPNLISVSKQFYRYAYGDGLAHRVSVSLILNLLAIIIAIALIISSSLMASIIFLFYSISWPLRKKIINLKCLIISIPIALTIQISRGVGYMAGIIHSYIKASI